jgi:hypothetical protein
MDGPGNVAVGSVERFQGSAAGKTDPFETELAALPFLDLVDPAAAALDTGVTKLPSGGEYLLESPACFGYTSPVLSTNEL